MVQTLLTTENIISQINIINQRAHLKILQVPLTIHDPMAIKIKPSVENCY